MTALAENIEKLQGHLARFQSSGIQNRIGGRDHAGSGVPFTTISPVDKSVICTVARGTADDIDAAAKAARDAFPAWRDMPALERKKILIRVAEGIEARATEIALCECWDTGQAWRFMSKAALRGAENFRYFADQVTSARDGQSLPSATLMNVTTRKPIGPVGVITPWNTPFMLSTWKIAPALAAGCTVVHKPAEASPLTARLLVEIAEEAGLPPGVLNRQRLRRRGGQSVDRTSVDPRDCLCWRKPHGIDDHETRGRHAEADASGTGRQKPRGGV